MKCMISYLKPYFPKMGMGLVIKVLGTFADLGLPWVLSYILDDVIPKQSIRHILLWGVVMLLLAIMARQLNIIANRMASKVARDSVEQIRHDTFQKICYLSGSQVDQLSVPSLISRMTSDTYHLHSTIGMMQRLGVRAPLVLIGGIILTATLDWALTLVLVGTLPLLALVVWLVSKTGIPMYLKVQKKADQMVQNLRENITGIRVIKALSKTEYEQRRFYDINEGLSANEQKAGYVMALSSPFMNLFMNLGLAIVIIVGAYRVNAGQMQPGKIIAFLTYFTMILHAMMMVTRLFVSYSKAIASAKRIQEVLFMPEDLQVEESDKDEIQSPKAIEFRHVSFSYDEDAHKYSAKDISFGLKKGETLGIIGSTGSGKTTLINLLMRFYDVNEGSIYINGENIQCIPLDQLRRKFGTVFQNDVIFADTIRENISFGRNLSEEQIEKAASWACAMDFIGEKAEKMDFMAAMKGANLSGGQKQRILIARALAGNPEILVFDDSSSALDYKTDAMLRKAIRENFSTSTVITVAQRISSVMYMDKILVLEDGEAIGYGTNDELLEHCKVYQEIYESQMGGGIL